MSKKEIPVDEISNKNVDKKQTTEEMNSILENEGMEEELNDSENESKDAAAKTENTSPSSTKEQLEKELSDMKDKYLRVFAEFDNYRKRTIKERQELIKLASKDALDALLPAVGDFGRAIKASDESGEAGSEKLPEGIILVYNKLFKALEQQGIKEIDSTGQVFDADLHEAIAKIPAPTEDLKGKVIDTIEKGYYLNDKIIRFAKVVVGE